MASQSARLLWRRAAIPAFTALTVVGLMNRGPKARMDGPSSRADEDGDKKRRELEIVAARREKSLDIAREFCAFADKSPSYDLNAFQNLGLANHRAGSIMLLTQSRNTFLNETLWRLRRRTRGLRMSSLVGNILSLEVEGLDLRLLLLQLANCGNLGTRLLLLRHMLTLRV